MGECGRELFPKQIEEHSINFLKGEFFLNK